MPGLNKSVVFKEKRSEMSESNDDGKKTVCPKKNLGL